MNAHVGKPFDINHLVSVLLGLVPDKSGATSNNDVLSAPGPMGRYIAWQRPGATDT